MTNHIEEPLYKTITENIPILCVDIVVKYEDKYLLVKRNTEPMKDVFWPIGGRIYKAEAAFSAAKRKLFEEANIKTYNDLYPIGFYEDVFLKNAFSDNVVYHTLSIVYRYSIHEHDIKNIKLDNTSSEWKLNNELPLRFKVTPFRGY
jgi:ADP-ribose pyrophosphatase YjhB (NUDIX family)